MSTKKIDKEIGELAVMVAKGFDRVDKRIGAVEGRLENVEEGLQSVRGSILDLGDRSVQRYEFEDLRTRFDGLEQKVK